MDLSRLEWPEVTPEQLKEDIDRVIQQVSSEPSSAAVDYSRQQFPESVDPKELLSLDVEYFLSVNAALRTLRGELEHKAQACEVGGLMAQAAPWGPVAARLSPTATVASSPTHRPSSVRLRNLSNLFVTCLW